MSANNRVNILGDVGLSGSLIMLQNNESFPANPALGTLVIKEYGLYAYIQVGELQTWYPFNNNKTKSYVHTQSSASSRWTINHSLNSNEVWFQVYSSSGVPMFASRSDITVNSFKLDLAEASTGTVVVVSPDTIDVPYVKSQSFTVGEGTANVTVIDNSGIRVNGDHVLTSATVQPLSADLTAIDELAGNSGFLKKTGVNTWELANPTTLSDYGITDAVNSSSLGVANGVATLDSDGKVPSSQLPSYVDDILEYVNLAGFPATGSTGIIYVDKATNKTYRWSGSAYIEVSAGINTFAELSDKPTTLSGYGITDAATSSNPTFSGTMTNNASVRSEINSISSGMTIDCSLGNYFTKTLNGDATLAFSNVPASGVAYSCTLRVEHTSGTLSWPSSVYWPSNQSLPSLTAGKVHIFVFITEDGGTKWRAAALTNYNG